MKLNNTENMINWLRKLLGEPSKSVEQRLYDLELGYQKLETEFLDHLDYVNEILDRISRRNYTRNHRAAQKEQKAELKRRSGVITNAELEQLREALDNGTIEMDS